MASFYDELVGLVAALDPEQALYEAHPVKPVDESPEAVSLRLKLACGLGEVCRSLRRVGRRLRAAREPAGEKPS